MQENIVGKEFTQLFFCVDEEAGVCQVCLLKGDFDF